MLSSSEFSSNILFAFLVFYTRAACLCHPKIILLRARRLLLLCRYLQPTVPSSIRGPSILLSALHAVPKHPEYVSCLSLRHQCPENLLLANLCTYFAKNSVNLRYLCFFAGHTYCSQGTRQFADLPRDVIMEELYAHKKLGPCCCDCILMNNLRRKRRSNPTSSFHLERQDGKFPARILMTETLRVIQF